MPIKKSTIVILARLPLSLSTLDGFYNSLIVRKNNRKVHKAENKITKSHLDKFKVAFLFD
jgi:hypothetical protein